MINHLVRATSLFTALLLLNTPTSAITNGQLDGTSHPAVGLVAQTVGSDACQPEARFTSCAGVLLAADVFLVQGACAENLQFNVQFGYRTWLILDADPVDWGALSNPWLDCTKFLPVSSIVLSPDRVNADVGLLLLAAPQSQIPPAALPTEGRLRKIARRPSGLTVVAYGDTGDPTDTETDPATFYRRYATARIGTVSPTTHEGILEPGPGGVQPCTQFESGAGPTFITGTNTVVSIEFPDLAACSTSSTFLRLDTAGVRSFLSGYVTVP